jgi:hypothetical protein
MSVVTDFKAIRRKLERQDQKAEFEDKNPPPPAWYSQPVVWTPDRGYAPAGKP